MQFWRCTILPLLALGTTTLFIFTLGSAPLRAADYVVVVLDDSGSMKQRMPDGLTRMDAAKQALKTVLSQLPAETNVGVLTLNTVAPSGAWIVPVGPVGQTEWQSRIDAIRANGGTPLGRFIKDAADELLKLRAADRYGSFRLLILTDGEASDPQNLKQYLPDILSRGLSMDVIGVSMPGEHSLAKLSHSYRSAEDARTLTEAISEVFAEPVQDSADALADFALLEGLPEGFAEAALQALATVRNEPIAAREINAEEGGQRFDFQRTTSAPLTVQASWAKLGTGLLCCCGGVFVLMVVSAAMIAARVSRRR